MRGIKKNLIISLPVHYGCALECNNEFSHIGQDDTLPYEILTHNASGELLGMGLGKWRG